MEWLSTPFIVSMDEVVGQRIAFLADEFARNLDC
jgi:uncharacterized protein YicC (UPF0701 family)